MIKKLIQFKLKFWSKLVLKKYKPEAISISGSVGKTSTKEAVYAVLSKKFKVRRSTKNYNNEIGVPLTILGTDSPGNSLVGWIRLGIKIIKLLIKTDVDYPKLMILELGIDKPGDMDYLNSFIRSTVGIITLIGPVHIEYFGSIEKIQEEKGKLIKGLPKSGTAILNYDNEQTRQMANSSSAKVFTFGFHEKATVRAEEVVFSFEKNDTGNNLRGISFKLGYGGSFVPVLLPKVVGYNSIYAALAGAACGIAYGMNLVEISEALRDFDSPKGRMNLISGIKNTLIVDDTYNASPQSMRAAIEILKRLPKKEGARKYAILGDMLELGAYTEEAHREIGKYLSEIKIDGLVVVGERSRDIARGSRESGMDNDKIFHFPESGEAGKFLKERLNAGDIILIKGSQGMRMERAVKELMSEPEKAENLLVRQEQAWLNKA